MCFCLLQKSHISIASTHRWIGKGRFIGASIKLKHQTIDGHGCSTVGKKYFIIFILWLFFLSNSHNCLHDMKFLSNIFGCIGVVAPIMIAASPPEFPSTPSFRRHCSFVFVVEYRMLATCWSLYFLCTSPLTLVLFAVGFSLS